MKWTDDYSVDIREIDDQHKKLVHLFSTIQDSANFQRSSWKDILYGIIALRDIAKSHFEFEEGLMRLYGYAKLAEHAEFHSHFFAKLDEIASKTDHEPAATELLQFLSDWLKDHLLEADRGYARYILDGAAIVRSNAPST